MATNFRIPKQTDREIAVALGRIREHLHSQIDLKVRINVPITGNIEITEKKPEQNKQLKYIFDLNSNVVDSFSLVTPTNQVALQIVRQTDQITDLATIPDDWIRQQGQPYDEKLPQIFVNLLASARAELKAPEVEAGFKGADDTAWNRYRDAQ